MNSCLSTILSKYLLNFFLFFVSTTICFSQTKKDTLDAIHTVWQLDEVQQIKFSIDSVSLGKRKLSLQLRSMDKECIYICAVEDNGFSFVTYYHFCINSHNNSIEILDTPTGEWLDIQAWRKSRHN